MADSAGVPGLEILATPARRPGAVCIGLAGIDRAALMPLLSSPEFVALAQRIPCWVAAQEFLALDAEVQEVLAAAGCGALADHEVAVATSTWPTVLGSEKRWVSGDWYLAPPIKPTAHQLASRVRALRLVQLVAADADNHEIEAILRQDPGMAYQLLRLVNSPGIGFGRQVDSFAQAIAILGRQHLRRWLNLLIFAARKDDPRAAMLLARAALRSRRMELIEKAQGGDRAAQEQAFMVGMFSLVGVLFGIPLPEVLQPLHFDAAMESALCRLEGELGRQLQFVLMLESAAAMAAPAFRQALAKQEISAHELGQIGFAACCWMLEVVDDAAGSNHV